MNNTAYYLKIHVFLQGHAGIWEDSILQRWPSSRVHFPVEWLSALAELNDEDLKGFANGECPEHLPFELRRLVEDSQSFEIEPLQVEEKLDAIDAQGLNLKKQHEIERLLPILRSECLGQGVTHAVDIGGGMGHLARLCVKHFQWRFHTIDRDTDLQAKGEWWLKRSRNLDRSKLTFVPGEVQDQKQSIDSFFDEPETLSLGLHTCGSLAVSQFRKSLKSHRLINFGCCFDKIEERDRNLSRVAKGHPVPWNQSSLFLATRGRKTLSVEEYKLLKRVNDYRFALHLLFQENFPEKGFLIAGDASKALYQKSFSEYAHDRFLKLGLSPLSNEAFQDFYDASETKATIQEIFVAHLIRNLFARPLELLLLTDRALWLEEQGFQTKITAAFDREVSPRNIALIARRSDPADTSP